MRKVTIYYCETCGESFAGENAKLTCAYHENECEKYKVDDRVEVFFRDKWWRGIVIHVSMRPDQKRFMVIRTDEQVDEDVDMMHTGHDLGIWENTGDKNYIRRIVDRKVNISSEIKSDHDVDILISGITG